MAGLHSRGISVFSSLSMQRRQRKMEMEQKKKKQMSWKGLERERTCWKRSGLVRARPCTSDRHRPRSTQDGWETGSGEVQLGPKLGQETGAEIERLGVE